MNNMMPSNHQSARERAASLMQARFGPTANPSINSLNAQSHAQAQAPLTMPGQPHPQNLQQAAPNGQTPQVKQEPGYPPMSQPFLGNAQSDGASDALADWKAEVARRREAAQRQPGKNDRILREHLRQRMLEMEGGGLLMPLEERQQSSSSSSSSPTSRKLAANLASLNLSDSPSSMAATNTSSSVSQPPTARAQFDGPGGDDEKVEDDEDAINSDLDDPEDHEAEENDAEDAVGQVMLCTYDKVQRVKNKWKCTLKDGILTTGGKE